MSNYLTLVNNNKHNTEILPDVEEDFTHDTPHRLRKDESLSSLFFEVQRLMKDYYSGKIIHRTDYNKFLEKIFLLYEELSGQEHENKSLILNSLPD